jgi:hypothetical protein
MMDFPTQTCRLCGRAVTVVQNGSGFPPERARKRLVRACRASGCPSDPVYRAGIDPTLTFAATRGACPHCGARGLLTDRLYRKHRTTDCAGKGGPR